MNEIDDLNEKIKKFLKADKIKKNEKKLWQYGQIFNIAIDLCANIFVGLFIGLFIDRYFDSKPFGLLICLILSVFSAFKMIVKSK